FLPRGRKRGTCQAVADLKCATTAHPHSVPTSHCARPSANSTARRGPDYPDRSAQRLHFGNEQPVLRVAGRTGRRRAWPVGKTRTFPDEVRGVALGAMLSGAVSALTRSLLRCRNPFE